MDSSASNGRPENMDGVIVVDKPEGWTSHDAVNKLRRLAKTRRVGHLGTLDPIATGVLPLVIGRATRLARFYLSSGKEYEATVRFGFSTNTYDREGTATSPVTEPIILREQIEALLPKFEGTIPQTPPPVSAKKVGGAPAYKLVRKDIAFELKPVEVTIHSIELLACEESTVKIRVACSAGTYMRSLAHDWGQLLGCGAHLAELRRLSSSGFTLSQAMELRQLEELAQDGRLKRALIPAACLLPHFPSETVDAVTAAQIRHGRDFRVSPFGVRKESRFVKAISPDGKLLAIGEAILPHVYHPVLVF